MKVERVNLFSGPSSVNRLTPCRQVPAHQPEPPKRQIPLRESGRSLVEQCATSKTRAIPEEGGWTYGEEFSVECRFAEILDRKSVQHDITMLRVNKKLPVTYRCTKAIFSQVSFNWLSQGKKYLILFSRATHILAAS